MTIIYHITKLNWWEKFKKLPFYESETLNQEGFIHCSESQYLERVLALYFKGQKDLVLIHIDSDKVKPEIKYELAPDNISFPHIYGQLNKEAIIKVEDIIR